MKYRDLLRKIGLSLATVVVCLLIAEVGCRLSEAWTRFRASDEPPLHIATGTPVIYGLNPAHPEISTQGLRDDEVAIPKPAGTLRILLLGDSVVYGEAVTRDKTLANVLERQLQTQKEPVEVLNAGVNGYTAYNELQYYLSVGRTFAPDLVVVAFCLNDVANPRLHWALSDTQQIPIPEQAIPNPEYDRKHAVPRLRDPNQDPRAVPVGRMGRALGRFALYRAVEPGLGRWLARNDVETGIPTQITAEDDLSIEVLLDEASPEWRWLTAIYDRLHRAVQADGATLVVAMLPLAYQLDEDYPYHPQEHLAAYCRERSIPCLDLLPALRGHAPRDVFLLDRPGFHDIWHLTEQGHALSAAALLSFLQEQDLL